MDYEVIVKYVDRGNQVFNSYYQAPPTSETTEVPPTSTRLEEPYKHSEHRSINPSPPQDRRAQQRMVSYTCSDYRVESGVLIMTDGTHGAKGPGTMIPLTSIEEIIIDIAQDDLKQIKKDYKSATGQVAARQTGRRNA